MNSLRRPFERALVAGGAGFLGTHLCALLGSRGLDVVVVDDLSTGDRAGAKHLHEVLPDGSFQFIEHDIAAGRLDDGLVGPVDVVFDLASPASPLDYARLPIETLRAGSEGTRHLLDLATELDARFVLTSTSEVYGDPVVHPQDETYWGNVNPIGPRSVYDEAKRFAEALTMAYHRTRGTDVGIVRLFNTYGPRMRPDDGRAVPAFITQALGGLPLTVAGDGTQTRSLCYVDDIVRGLVAMAESDATGPINLGNPTEVSVHRLAYEIDAAVHEVCPEAPPSAGVQFVDRPIDDPQLRCPDISRARSLLGWEPTVTRPEGLRRTVEWFARPPRR